MARRSAPPAQPPDPPGSVLGEEDPGSALDELPVKPKPPNAPAPAAPAQPEQAPGPVRNRDGVNRPR
jgi:hypothetical protein